MVTSTTATVVELTRFLFFPNLLVRIRARVPLSFHMFPTAREKEEACFGVASWICVASVDEPAQAPVSDVFPFASDRAGIGEACFGALSWISVASAWESAQAQFPTVLA